MFGTFGRKTLAIMLICIGDGIRDSLIILKNFTIIYALYKNDYKSKLSSLSKKSKRPIVSMPSSLRRGMMWSFTMITFLKESLMFVRERDSCISFSLSGIDNADCT